MNDRSRLRAWLPCAGFACAVLVGSFLLLSPTAGWTQGFGKVKAKAPPKEEGIPSDMTPERVDSYLAGLSDEQARRLLSVKLKEETAAKSGKETRAKLGVKDTAMARAFFEALSALSALSEQLGGIFTGAYASAETDAWEKLIGGKGPVTFLTALALLALIILTGWSAERLLLHGTERLRSQLLEGVPHGGVWEKTGLLLSGLILDGLGLGVYLLVTFLAYFVIYGQRPTAYLVSSFLILSYYFRLIVMAARLITSPKAPGLRLLPLPDSDACFLYNWIICISASVIPVSALAFALQKSGASRELFLMVYSSTGPIMSLLLSVMIWQVRHRVAQMICPLGDQCSIPASMLRQRCAEYWHYPAILFALAIGGTWWARVLVHGDARMLWLILSLFLVPLFIGMDQWLRQMLTKLGGRPREVIDFREPLENGAEEPERPGEVSPSRRETTSGKDMSIYFPLIRRIFRVVLLVFLVFATLELWGIEFDIGWIFAKSVLGVIIALALGLIVWEVVKALIDRRIEEEMPFLGDDAEEGGGGSGGSRSGTLLLLLRKFILVFLFVVVGFSVLASLGVNIAPLLAGAGVLGLAIGFGSQTLVKDIISGIFFLIDDAFRVGDYVEAGAAKGTVEHISLRSLTLRHPRGQVFIVPFGDLNMVQNFTRDYIIEKLDVRVRFDTDPDVIRKIIKRINKEVRQDEELANVLLSDIKSAGVREMDDSAMIMRVKFKCIPGEQFILRREIFHRLQRAFKEKGIEFAHRNVTVYLPPQPTPGEGPAHPGPERGSVEAAGAAAAAAIAQAEEEALAKLKEKKKPD